jgi:hypothetical protein
MAVCKVKPKDRGTYTMIENETIRDNRLSFDTTGLLAFMLSHSDEYVFSKKNLRKERGLGGTAIVRMFRELTTFGYLVRVAKHGAGGRFRGWDWTIHEVSQLPDVPKIALDKCKDELPEEMDSHRDSGLPNVGKTKLPVNGASGNRDESKKDQPLRRNNEEEVNGANAPTPSISQTETGQNLQTNLDANPLTGNLPEDKKPSGKSNGIKKKLIGREKWSVLSSKEMKIQQQMCSLLAAKCYHEADINQLTDKQRNNTIDAVEQLRVQGGQPVDINRWWDWFLTSGDFQAKDVVAALALGNKISCYAGAINATFNGFRASPSAKRAAVTTKYMNAEGLSYD